LFPVRYELHLYIIFRIKSVFEGIIQFIEEETRGMSWSRKKCILNFIWKPVRDSIT
jgi:hypothetical protein